MARRFQGFDTICSQINVISFDFLFVCLYWGEVPLILKLNCNFFSSQIILSITLTFNSYKKQTNF